MTGDTERVLADIDDAIDGYVTWDGRSPDAMCCGPRRDGGEEALRQACAEIGRHVDAQMRAIVQAFEPVRRAVLSMNEAFGEMARKNHPVFAVMRYGDDYRRHYRGCRLCNPAGNPKPLAVNGAEYRRRRRSRSRRNRR